MRTPGGLVKRLGRAVLWLLVLVLLLRGVASVMEPRRPGAVAATAKPAVASWPDDEVRAFASDFARAYLTYNAKDPEASESAIRAFVGPELASSVVPEYGEDAPRRAVGSVSVARVLRVDDSRALVTVAAAATGGTRYLTVPVARDARGGLVVSDLPSLAAPPTLASAPQMSGESLPASERAPIEDVVSRFLTAYLAGDAGELSFFTPTGVRIGALAAEHELVDVTSLALVAPAQGRVREVMATVRAKDAATGATYGLRYRLQLVREDRWLVAAVNSSKKAG
ncbi:conjugal transfer protein [Solirubrobacter sp. CPCC 204708]|uniref:Conjugal transfer protein n=1 Tax=Solirubrobacter deserti TaxID=2282478 RepID=A0ABT4RD01_9ACTN|nr:conjugal transfer protein [Solirubrobacter deserti]MBE2317826.1 conjugal transfer protein [Solirubrobacter deserti]MDA0136397.1 conjugal transfer protein [Solirubrobacter deserti]